MRLIRTTYSLQTTRLFQAVILLFISATFNGCSIEGTYSVTKKHRIIISDQQCKVSYYFPVIATNSNNDAFYETNKLLRQIGDYDQHAANCIKSSGTGAPEKISIEGDFNVLMATDSILSIEFISTRQTGTAAPRQVYISIVINPFTRKQLSLEELLPGFNRKMIYPFIKEVSVKNGNAINMLAYEEGSNYVITYGITKEKLLIYPGDEGEGRGLFKVEIPLSEIGLKLKE